MEKGEIVGALKKDLKMLIKQLDGLFQALHEGAQILSDEAKEAIDLSIGDCYEKLRHRVPNWSFLSKRMLNGDDGGNSTQYLTLYKLIGNISRWKNKIPIYFWENQIIKCSLSWQIQICAHLLSQQLKNFGITV